MKGIVTIIFVLALFFSANAQQPSSFSCALDNFIEIERAKNPNYDQQMTEKEKLKDEWKTKYGNNTNKKSILTIPVVVHVVWNGSADSISAAQVLSQIDVLNADYMRLNADTINTPSAFQSIAANPQIQFCLATRDPQGNCTTGITYTQTSKTVFNLVSGDTSIWHTAKGGFDGWDPSQYYNIWVADIGVAGGIGFWPGAVFPGHREGIVVNYTFFGTMGSAIAPYNLGRTVTHETGHFLDLHHLWGDVGNNASCGASDYCNDTPPQVKASQNCPTFPLLDGCTGTYPGLAFVDFMDYPSDACKNMFTADQVSRMRDCLNGVRSSLLTSPACTLPTGIDVVTACGPYTWIDGNTYSVDNNTATHMLTTTAGCDSIITLNFNISTYATGTDLVTACNSLMWIDGNTYTSSNNSAKDTIINGSVNGCDSIVTLNLTVNTIDNTITNSSPMLMANQIGAAYQWLDCDNGNAIMPSETAQSYTALANGNYAVEITMGICVDTSVCENVTGVGLKETTKDYISIYPNPTNGLFTIDLGIKGSLTNYTITTIEGRIVVQGRISENKIIIDLSEESKGIYFLKIKQEDIQNVYRIMRQ